MLQAEVASRFSICQVGVCLFTPAPDDPAALVCDAYNIDTFDARRDLTASPGALAFLAANGFNFNEWYSRHLAASRIGLCRVSSLASPANR